MNRTIVVTGAAAGLGEGIARRLAHDGFEIAVTDRDAEGAERVAESIRLTGRRASAYLLDVTDPSNVNKVINRVAAEQPSLYGLVNNAGIGTAIGFLDLSLGDWERIFAVNSTGTFLVSQAVLRHLAEKREGTVVNISSIAGKEGYPNWVHYGSTKHAIIGMTRGLAREFGSLGIRVNAVCPGAIKTAIWSAEAQGTDNPDQLFQDLASRTALQRNQSVEEIANATAFLVGDNASSISGVSLSVDSGLLFS